ncbi:MAG: FAD-dependent monooxygenase, partial [Alphaproteobacteria bacterium]|nr:FAD-dependent monooxygenase [Alphaproteobacteria bacterium]
KLVDQGLITPKFQYRDLDDGLIAEFDHALIKDHTDHPFRLQCEQFKLTRVVAGMLEDFPDASIRYDCRVSEVSQNGDGVTVRVDTPGGIEETMSDYLIGCDGSRSVVRKSIDMEFEGFTYPEQFVIASVSESIDEIVPDMGHVAYISHPHAWGALIHAPDFWRFMYPIPVDMTQEEAFEDEFLQQRLKRLVPYEGHYSTNHLSIYAVNQRVAKCYRRGRVTLAGDSAHVNNPLGGMGMNGGIHDGINVAEKLVAVLNEGESDDLLDKYDRQRRPIANDYVQTHSIRNKQMIEEADPAVRRQRQDDLRAIADDPQRSIDLLLQTSMIHAVRKSQSIE